MDVLEKIEAREIICKGGMPAHLCLPAGTGNDAVQTPGAEPGSSRTSPFSQLLKSATSETPAAESLK